MTNARGPFLTKNAVVGVAFIHNNQTEVAEEAGELGVEGEDAARRDDTHYVQGWTNVESLPRLTLTAWIL